MRAHCPPRSSAHRGAQASGRVQTAIPARSFYVQPLGRSTRRGRTFAPEIASLTFGGFLIATVLQSAYLELKASGLGHFAACRILAARTGLDDASVDRSIRRAEQDDRRSTRRRPRPVLETPPRAPAPGPPPVPASEAPAPTPPPVPEAPTPPPSTAPHDSAPSALETLELFARRAGVVTLA